MGLPNVYSTVLKNNFAKWLNGRYRVERRAKVSQPGQMSCVSVKRIAPEIEGGRWFHGWGNVNTGSSVKWVVSAGVVWSLRQSVGCEPGAELSETFWRQPSFLFGWKFDLYFIGTEKKTCEYVSTRLNERLWKKPKRNVPLKCMKDIHVVSMNFRKILLLFFSVQ